jgi:hypothetical protein
VKTTIRLSISCFILAAIVLSQFRAAAQAPSSLRIAPKSSGLTMSWTNNSSLGFPLSTLEVATNLSRPVFWDTELLFPYQTTHLAVPVTAPQQYFRLAPMLPIFQFAIFYNQDLEINPGYSAIVNGNTFVNGNIWSAPSGALTFNGTRKPLEYSIIRAIPMIRTQMDRAELLSTMVHRPQMPRHLI